MKRIMLLLGVLAALVFAGSAAANKGTHYGHVNYNGSPCGSACQMIVSTHDGTNIVSVGSVHTWSGPEYANPFTLYAYTVCVGGCSWNYNSYAVDRCTHTTCNTDVWYRRACFSGYQFSQTKSGYTWSTADPFWWGNFTINTTGCFPSAAAAGLVQ